MSLCVAAAVSIIDLHRQEYWPFPGAEPRAEGGTSNITIDQLQAFQRVQDVRTAMQKFSVGLAGMDLPEAFRPMRDSLCGRVNELLDKMPKLEAHKAATDANYALNSLDCAVNSLHECMTRAENMVRELATTAAKHVKDKETAMNALIPTKVTEGIEEGIKAGTLFRKDAFDAAVKAATENGRTLAMNGIKLLDGRRQKIVEAKLPMPVDGAALEGEDSAFTALLAKATERKTTLATCGLTVETHKDLVTRLLYSATGDGEIASIKSALEAAGVKPKQPDAGGGGGGGATEVKFAV